MQQYPLILASLSACLLASPVALASETQGQAPDLPNYVCHPIQEIGKDGWPATAAWDRLPSTGPFLDGEQGEKAKFRTEACMGWTEEGLFIRWISEDPHIWTSFKNRDDPLWEEEVVEVFLATSQDPYSYYELEIAPNNLIVDLDIRWPEANGKRSMKPNRQWNAPGSRSRVTIDGTLNDASDRDRSWTAFLFIPFRDMEAAPPQKDAESPVWRLNLYRIERPKNGEDEYAAWSPVYVKPVNFHTPNRFGTLTFSHQLAASE